MDTKLAEETKIQISRSRELLTMFKGIEFKIDTMQFLLMKLRMWSLIVLPMVGYVFGWALQLVFQTKKDSRYESLLVHGITMIFMIMTFNDILYNQEEMNDIKDKALLLCISYLFLFGAVLGIIV